MITFKSTEDLSKLSPDDPAHATVEELIEQLITAYSPIGLIEGLGSGCRYYY